MLLLKNWHSTLRLCLSCTYPIDHFAANETSRTYRIFILDITSGSGGGSAMGEISAQTKCGVGVVAVLLIGFIILLVASFADVNYYEVLNLELMP